MKWLNDVIAGGQKEKHNERRVSVTVRHDRFSLNFQLSRRFMFSCGAIQVRLVAYGLLRHIYRPNTAGSTIPTRWERSPKHLMIIFAQIMQSVLIGPYLWRKINNV